MTLPLGLVYDRNEVTCLTVVHMLLPEIGLNADLRKKVGKRDRWNGVLYLPSVPLHQVRKGDLVLFRYFGQPSHVGLVLSRDGGSLFEMWGYMTLINNRGMDLSPAWEVRRPSRVVVE